MHSVDRLGTSELHFAALYKSANIVAFGEPNANIPPVLKAHLSGILVKYRTACGMFSSFWQLCQSSVAYIHEEIVTGLSFSCSSGAVTLYHHSISLTAGGLLCPLFLFVCLFFFSLVISLSHPRTFCGLYLLRYQPLLGIFVELAFLVFYSLLL